MSEKSNTEEWEDYRTKVKDEAKGIWDKVYRIDRIQPVEYRLDVAKQFVVRTIKEVVDMYRDAGDEFLLETDLIHLASRERFTVTIKRVQ